VTGTAAVVQTDKVEKCAICGRKIITCALALRVNVKAFFFSRTVWVCTNEIRSWYDAIRVIV